MLGLYHVVIFRSNVASHVDVGGGGGGGECVTC